MQESKDSLKACFKNVNIVNLIDFNFLPGLQTRYLKKSSIWDAPFFIPTTYVLDIKIYYIPTKNTLGRYYLFSDK